MKIALLGYGKMGREIEAIATERGHSITHRITSQNRAGLTAKALEESDVAIEFSRPENAVANLLLCFEAGIPVVTGTTGWYDRMEKVQEACREKNGALVYATNFSVGVNIFFKLNQLLARVMKQYKQYEPSILEIHHTQKLDAPSGTAITLAEGIIAESDEKKEWVNEKNTDPSILEVISQRIDQVPGTHEITYHSSIDDISIKHTAHNRKGFALGAVIAAEWVREDKKGVYTMPDVLNVNFS